MSKNILILGASYAGLTVAHTLLKKTFTTIKDYKIILVAPNTDLYYNLASVRAIVPGQFSDEKVFQEIAPGFAKYPSGSFEFIVGKAASLDPATKTVTITTASAAASQTVTYEHLVIATGSRTIGDVPWKNYAEGGSEATKAGLHEYQEKVKAAKTIVIGGGGPTGVETAGELAFEYKGEKEITIITSAAELLVGSLPSKIAQGAEDQLVKMGVKMVKNTKIDSFTTLPDGTTSLALSTGETQIVDLYLPTVGVLPNSEFVPASLKNDKGDVVVDPFLRVKEAQNIWACGDVIDIEPSQIIYADKQAQACVKNIGLVLSGKEPVAYGYGGKRMLGLTLGRSKATGASGEMKLPGILVWWVKGRTLGTENLPKYVSGSKF